MLARAGKGTSWVTALILLGGIFVSSIIFLPTIARGATLYVGGAGPGNFTTIQAAIDTANPGDTVFVYNGTYNENITISKILSLAGESRNTTTIDGGDAGTVVTVTADWVNITGLTVSGAGHQGYGIFLDQVQNSRVADSAMKRNNYTGLSMASSGGSTIEDNIFVGNHFGIRGGGSGNVIARNNFSSNAEAISLGSSNDIIANNSFWLNDGQIFLTNAKGITISNNTLVRPESRYIGISIDRSQRIALKDNVMINNGIYLDGTQQIEWTSHSIDLSNTVNGKPVYYAKDQIGGVAPPGIGEAILAYSRGVVIQNQNFSGSGVGIELGFSWKNTISDVIIDNPGGIYLLQSHNNTLARLTLTTNISVLFDHSNDNSVSDSRISHCFYYPGIWSYVSSGLTIANNVITESAVGIELDFSGRSTVIGNVISNTTISGMLVGASDHTVIANNTVSDSPTGMTLIGPGPGYIGNNSIFNNQDGIYLNRSNANTIENNSFSTNSQRGLYIHDSSDNRVFHNSFVGNAMQAYDDIGQFSWDNGYPSGGNYWSDYTGVDVKSGPNQDMPGSDGMGDTPYDINQPFPGPGKSDRYPLMTRFAATPPSSPLVLRAKAGNGNVTLTWSPPGSDGGFPILNYTIYRGSSSGRESYLAKIGNITTYTDSGLQNGQAYYYQVSASNVPGEGLRSNEASATPSLQPPNRQPPHASISCKNQVQVGENVVLDAGGSTGNITRYNWIIRDEKGNVAATKEGKVVSHAFQTAGRFVVTLNVTDEVTNWSSEVSSAITVSSGPDWLLLGLGTAGIAGAAVLGFTEVGRVALLTLLAAPLHGRKVKGKDETKTRGMVLGYILGNPGDTYTDVRDALHMKNGAVAWHLMKLEKDGEIKSRVQGSRRRYYPTAMPLPAGDGGELHEIQQRLFKAVEQDPGKPVNVLAEELGVSRQLTLYHLKKLSRSGRLSIERRGLHMCVFLRGKGET